MAKPRLAGDFKEFLKLLNSTGVEYLLVGGYAVGIHGYIRATNDLDIWVNSTPENARRVQTALRDFGFAAAEADLFVTPGNVVRMGVPPLRLEILTSASGVAFDSCYAEREVVNIDGLMVPVISLARLRQNKAAAGRAKDLADLENLPR